jgi:rSAM/selenodomain-associated transferase 1
MRPLGNVYIFARAPMIGAVKRRLAADIGAIDAWRFHRENTRRLVRRIAADVRWRTWLAVTPDRRASKSWRYASGIGQFPQGQGDLGERMGRALAHDRTKPSIIVGSDIPSIEPAHIGRAFAALARDDAVFGPSPDGGYWLVGVRDIRLLPGLFHDVRWSGPNALADTLANVDSRRRVALIDTLADIDDGAAYARWRARARTP